MQYPPYIFLTGGGQKQQSWNKPVLKHTLTAATSTCSKYCNRETVYKIYPNVYLSVSRLWRQFQYMSW